MVKRRCEECGKEFELTRDWRKFCSDRCRMRAYWNRKVLKAAKELVARQVGS